MVERELVVNERRGFLWSFLLDEWEVAAKRGDIFIRPIQSQTVDDYVWLIRKHCADWMNLPANEIERAHAWVVLDRIERESSISRRKRHRASIDAVFKWAILSGRLKDVKIIPTEGYSSVKKEEDKLPEILNLEQIRTLLTHISVYLTISPD